MGGKVNRCLRWFVPDLGNTTFEKIVTTGVFIILLVMGSGLLLPQIHDDGPRPGHRVTANNASQLGRAIIVYCHAHNGSCPNKNTWCDDILDEAGTPKLFISPLDSEATKMEQAWPEKVSSYAFNATASELGKESWGRYPWLVILFESNLGWNGSGGLEEALGTLKAYDGKPIAVVLADGHVDLISSPEDLKSLMWKPKDVAPLANPGTIGE